MNSANNKHKHQLGNQQRCSNIDVRVGNVANNNIDVRRITIHNVNVDHNYVRSNVVGCLLTNNITDMIVTANIIMFVVDYMYSHDD